MTSTPTPTTTPTSTRPLLERSSTARAWREAWREIGWGWDHDALYLESMVDVALGELWNLPAPALRDWGRTQAESSLAAAEAGDHAGSVAALRALDRVLAAVDRVRDALLYAPVAERLATWATQYAASWRATCDTWEELFRDADALLAGGGLIDATVHDEVREELWFDDLLRDVEQVGVECGVTGWRDWLRAQVLHAGESALRLEVLRLRREACEAYRLQVRDVRPYLEQAWRRHDWVAGVGRAHLLDPAQDVVRVEVQWERAEEYELRLDDDDNVVQWQREDV